MNIPDIVSAHKRDQLIGYLMRLTRGKQCYVDFYQLPTDVLVLFARTPRRKIASIRHIAEELVGMIPKKQVKRLLQLWAEERGLQVSEKSIEASVETAYSDFQVGASEPKAPQKPVKIPTEIQKLPRSCQLVYQAVVELEHDQEVGEGDVFYTTLQALQNRTELSAASITRATKRLSEEGVLQWVPGKGRSVQSMVRRIV